MARVNYIKGSDGKMRGSFPSPVSPTETVTTPTLRHPSVFDSEGEGVLDYGAIREAMSDLVSDDRPAWLEETDDGQEINMRVLADHLAYHTHPAMQETRALGVDLDSAQRMHLMYSVIGSARNSIEKSPAGYLDAVTQEEWDNWHQEQADRVREDDPNLAVLYEQQVGQDPLTRMEFDVFTRSSLRTYWAAKSMDREIRYLAGFHDISVEDARSAFNAARGEFLDIPYEERPKPPEWFTDGLKGTYFAENHKKRPPLDPATAYALYDVFANPVRTAVYEKTGQGVVVFDTETTGTTHESEILQITCVHYDSQGNKVDQISTYVHPGAEEDGSIFTGSEGAVKVHGITEETVRNAPGFEEVAPRIHAMMEGRTIVGHNVMFDYPKVQRALAKAGHDTLSSGPIVDTMRLARYAQPNNGKPAREHPFRLRESCERAGIPFDDDLAHDAAYDVDRTAALFFKLRSGPFGGSASAEA